MVVPETQVPFELKLTRKRVMLCVDLLVLAFLSCFLLCLSTSGWRQDG